MLEFLKHKIVEIEQKKGGKSGWRYPWHEVGSNRGGGVHGHIHEDGTYGGVYKCFIYTMTFN